MNRILGFMNVLLLALFLLIVFGWILDSWHDPNGPWVGVIVTGLWSIAFLLSAGSPVLAYWLSRRKAAEGCVALAVWLPAIVLVTICAVGFIVFPP